MAFILWPSTRDESWPLPDPDPAPDVELEPPVGTGSEPDSPGGPERWLPVHADARVGPELRAFLKAAERRRRPG